MHSRSNPSTQLLERNLLILRPVEPSLDWRLQRPQKTHRVLSRKASKSRRNPTCACAIASQVTISRHDSLF
jgi:hypothetical protein